MDPFWDVPAPRTPLEFLNLERQVLRAAGQQLMPSWGITWPERTKTLRFSRPSPTASSCASETSQIPGKIPHALSALRFLSVYPNVA